MWEGELDNGRVGGPSSLDGIVAEELIAGGADETLEYGMSAISIHPETREMRKKCHSQVDHAIEDALRLILEKDRLVMPTPRACVLGASRQCGVLHELVNDARLFLGDAHKIVAEHHLVLRLLLVRAVPACIEQRLRRAVYLRVQEIVAAHPGLVRGHTPCNSTIGMQSSPFRTEVERRHRRPWTVDGARLEGRDEDRCRIPRKATRVLLDRKNTCAFAIRPLPSSSALNDGIHLSLPRSLPPRKEQNGSPPTHGDSCNGSPAWRLQAQPRRPRTRIEARFPASRRTLRCRERVQVSPPFPIVSSVHLSPFLEWH